MERMTRWNPETEEAECEIDGVVHTGSITTRLAEYEDTGLDPEEVERYAKAEKEGRLLVLPCKVGDMVYFRRGRDIIGDTVERIVLDGMNQVFVGAHKVFIFRDFGKTVFLTREDAEKALEGTKND